MNGSWIIFKKTSSVSKLILAWVTNLASKVLDKQNECIYKSQKNA